MNLSNLKGRLAEALVESIFRESGYTVSRLGRESQVHRLLKVGADEFLPDFLAWRPADRSGLYRLLTIETKYRARLQEFLRRDAERVFSEVKAQWPDLYFVLVTDDPEDRRFCFQVVHLASHVPGIEPLTTDLHESRPLGVE